MRRGFWTLAVRQSRLCVRAGFPEHCVSRVWYIGLLVALTHTPLSGEVIRRGVSPLTHAAETVTVTGEGLIHTAQFLATDSEGTFVGGDAKAQTRRVLDNLQATLVASGSKTAAIVKLNLYVGSSGFLDPVLEIVKQRFANDGLPAISVVETALPERDALVSRPR